MDIKKVTEAVKLQCQLINLEKKLYKLINNLTNEEKTEYLKRMK